MLIIGEFLYIMKSCNLEVLLSVEQKHPILFSSYELCPKEDVVDGVRILTRGDSACFT